MRKQKVSDFGRRSSDFATSAWAWSREGSSDVRALGRTSGNGHHARSWNSACSTAWASVRRGSVGFLLILETCTLDVGPAFASIALDPLSSVIPVDANETSIVRTGDAAMRRIVSGGAGVNQRLRE